MLPPLSLLGVRRYPRGYRGRHLQPQYALTVDRARVVTKGLRERRWACAFLPREGISFGCVQGGRHPFLMQGWSSDTPTLRGSEDSDKPG
jgi:hypothetical protein